MRKESLTPSRIEPEGGIIILDKGSYFSDDPTFEEDCLSPFIEGLEPGARVLDLACGAGIETRKLEQAGFKVYPLDKDPAFLRILRQRFPDWMKWSFFRMLFALSSNYGWFDGRFELEAAQRRVLGDARNIPFAPNSFDGILCKHLLTFGDDEERLVVLKGIHTVLRPGGRVALYQEYREDDFPLGSRKKLCRITPSSTSSLLEKAGFSEITTREVLSDTDRWAEPFQLFQMVAFARKPEE